VVDDGQDVASGMANVDKEQQQRMVEGASLLGIRVNDHEKIVWW
jgi:hypothetical protein